MYTAITYVSLCYMMVSVVAEQCPEPLDLINSSCVVVGGNVYHKVTQMWEPRISEIEGWVIQILPITLTYVIAVLYLTNTKPDLRELVRGIKEGYQYKMLHICFKAWFGKELFSWMTKPGEMEPTHEHYSLFKLRDKERGYRNPGYYLSADKEGVYLRDWEDVCDARLNEEEEPVPVRVGGNKSGKVIPEVRVQLRHLIKCHKPTRLIVGLKCTKVQVPSNIKWILYVKAICSNIGKVLIDLADVAKDCIYFVQLERGVILDPNITRNTAVINGILVFAILGAVKFPYYAAMQLKSLTGGDNSAGEDVSNVFGGGKGYAPWKPLPVCFKVLLEEGPELLLEYFYCERYSTSNQQWLYVFLAYDIIKAVQYFVPIYKHIEGGVKYYKGLSAGVRMKLRHVAGVTCQVLIGVIFITRVIQMICQLTGQTLAKECLHVTESGQLTQTPFASGCMNGFDYTILVLSVLMLALLVLVFVLTVPDTIKTWKEWYNECNDTRFYNNGFSAKWRCNYLHGDSAQYETGSVSKTAPRFIFNGERAHRDDTTTETCVL